MMVVVEAQTKGTIQSKALLRVPLIGLENNLAVLLFEEEGSKFPFIDGQIVTVPLIVSRIGNDPETNLQIGHLVPAGNELDVLLYKSVELFDG